MCLIICQNREWEIGEKGVWARGNPIDKRSQKGTKEWDLGGNPMMVKCQNRLKPNPLLKNSVASCRLSKNTNQNESWLE